VLCFVNTLVLSHLDKQEVTFFVSLLERLIDSFEILSFSGFEAWYLSLCGSEKQEKNQERAQVKDSEFYLQLHPAPISKCCIVQI
jgi:hypothetical protein